MSSTLSSKRQRKDFRETKDKEEVGRQKNGKVWKNKYLDSKMEDQLKDGGRVFMIQRTNEED